MTNLLDKVLTVFLFLSVFTFVAAVFSLATAFDKKGFHLHSTHCLLTCLF